MAALTDTIPIALGADGVYRIGDTRVTLDLVVRAFHRGATAEEIAQRFDSLSLPDVYRTIGYYLNHRSEFESYLSTREAAVAHLDSSHPEWSPVGLRERLMARVR